MLSKPDKYVGSVKGNNARLSPLMLIANTTTTLDLVIHPSWGGIITFGISALGTLSIFWRRELSGFLKKRQGSREQGAWEKEQKGGLDPSTRTTYPRHHTSQGSFPPAPSKVPPASSLNTIAKFSEHYKITSSAFIVLGVFLLLDAVSQTAQAQFFQNAENWMTGQFTGAQAAIALSFNVLRGLFILYLGISLVRVVQAARQDEDWQNLARTPMIILIAVTMGDILANLIIGGGGGRQ